MKVKVNALEIWEKGRLFDVRILGGEDDYEKEVCVEYEETTDILELKEVMKGWAEDTRINYLGRAIEKGRLLLQMPACHLPRKIGATEVKTVTKEIEW